MERKIKAKVRRNRGENRTYFLNFPSLSLEIKQWKEILNFFFSFFVHFFPRFQTHYRSAKGINYLFFK